jgi:hypothetical protein
VSKQSLERFLGGVLKPEYEAVRTGGDRGFDFVSRDGKRIMQAKLSLQSGTRDFRATVLDFATAVAREKDVSQAILLIRVGRLTAARALEEWQKAKEVLREDIAKRIALVLFAPDRDVVEPDTPDLRRLQALATNVLAKSTEPKTRLSVPWTGTVLEVWKVILASWLRCEPPLQVGEIERRSGTSYPTVAATLKLLGDREEIDRLSSRSVRLRALPRRSLGELVMLGRAVRMTTFFRDRTSREPDPLELLRRLRRKAPKGVALGGVIAARHYDKDFDLNGTPRLDVTMARDTSPSWWRELDPALEPVAAPEPGVVMVSHLSLRRGNHFEKAPGQPVPFADPAETLLDLYELRLEAQAEHLISTLRGSRNV